MGLFRLLLNHQRMMTTRCRFHFSLGVTSLLQKFTGTSLPEEEVLQLYPSLYHVSILVSCIHPCSMYPFCIKYLSSYHVSIHVSFIRLVSCIHPCSIYLSMYLASIFAPCIHLVSCIHPYIMYITMYHLSIHVSFIYYFIDEIYLLY